MYVLQSTGVERCVHVLCSSIVSSCNRSSEIGVNAPQTADFPNHFESTRFRHAARRGRRIVAAMKCVVCWFNSHDTHSSYKPASPSHEDMRTKPLSASANFPQNITLLLLIRDRLRVSYSTVFPCSRLLCTTNMKDAHFINAWVLFGSTV